jgi:cytochrome c biogenesis protein CcdA
MRGESRRGKLLRLGAFWGAGHLTTVALGVGLLTALRVTLEDDQLLLFETPVAVMLIGLGLWTLVTALGPRPTIPNKDRQSLGMQSTPRPSWWSYAVGSVHGLAGTGALVIFVAATFPDFSSALIYVVLFGVGAMLGMALITSTLAYPLRALEGRPRLYRALTAGAGGLSVVLGLGIVVELRRSFVGG